MVAAKSPSSLLRSVVVKVATVIDPVSVPATAAKELAVTTMGQGFTSQEKVTLVVSPTPSAAVTVTLAPVLLAAASGTVPLISPVSGSMYSPSGRPTAE